MPRAIQWADHYPAQTVKIITNVGVGGTYDLLARALADELQKSLGKPVVVEPRPGGNFLLAGRACAEAAADGYTVCALTGETVVYSELLFKKLPFDPRKDFAPISNLIFHTQLCRQRLAWSEVPWRTWLCEVPALSPKSLRNAAAEAVCDHTIGENP